MLGMFSFLMPHHLTFVTEKGSKVQESYFVIVTDCITNVPQKFWGLVLYILSIYFMCCGKHQFREALCGNIKTAAAISGKTDCGSYLCLSQGRS